MSTFFFKLAPYLMFFCCTLGFMAELNYTVRKAIFAAVFATGAAFSLVCAFENTMLTLAVEVLEMVNQKQATKTLGA